MIIGVDASRAVRETKTGTEHYSWELLNQLVKLPTKHHYWLYAPHLPKHTLNGQNVTWKIIPRSRLWSQIGLATELKRQAPDLLFVPSHVIPLFSNIPSVVTIHDIAYRYFPRAYSAFDRRYLEFTTGISLSKATRVITPTQATANDLVKFYGAKAQKLSIVPHGYNQEIFNQQPKGERPLPNPYIFFVGRIETKKNVIRIIEAFHLLAKQKKDIHAVLAGKMGYGSEEITARLQSLPAEIRSRIHLVGYMEEKVVANHLAHAEAFVFPSLYEGFGLPIIEAMACGCPVICSNTPALVEVAGSAATVLPPDSSLSWAAAIQRLIDDKKLRQQQITKGLERAKHFSWQRTAEETMDVIENAFKR